MSILEKEMAPVISVIIPIYNAERYLDQCISSVLNQMYQNLELLLIDDGSTDSGSDICRSYSQKDPRVCYVRQENAGVSAARNKGLELARGEWIGFVDSDDWIEPNFYETLMRLAMESGADIVACSSIYEFKNTSFTKRDSGDIKILRGTQELLDGYVKDYTKELWSKIYRRHVVDGFQFPVGKRCEDIAFCFHVFLHCEKMACFKKALYHYRQRKGSIMHAPKVNRHIEFWEIQKSGFDAVEAYLKEEHRKRMIYDCCMCAYKLWTEVAKVTRKERKLYEKKLREIAEVNRSFYSEVRRDKYSLYVKLIFLLTSHANGISYALISALYAIYSRFLRHDQFSGGELFD